MKDTIRLQKWFHQTPDAETIAQINTIYEDSFPPAEREPIECLTNLQVEKKRILFVVYQDNTIVGFASVRRFNDRSLLFLDYFAIKKEARNSGIGGRVLNLIATDLRRFRAAQALIWEVESPADSSGEVKHLRERRIQFYLRNGARLVEEHGVYRMPDISGRTESLPMRLMWLPLTKDKVLPYCNNIPRLFELIYWNVYGRNKRDSLLQKLIQALPEKSV